MKLNRKHWLILLVAPLMLLLDQVSKQIVHSTFKPFGQITLIPEYLELIFVTNRGLIFGSFTGKLGPYTTWIFLGITVVAFGIILHLFFRTSDRAVLLPLALSNVMAGALGNLIDRLRWGYVVDFIEMHWRGHYWPVYNVADISISIGIVLLLIDSFLPQPGPDQPSKEAG